MKYCDKVQEKKITTVQKPTIVPTLLCAQEIFCNAPQNNTFLNRFKSISNLVIYKSNINESDSGTVMFTVVLIPQVCSWLQPFHFKKFIQTTANKELYRASHI